MAVPLRRPSPGFPVLTTAAPTPGDSTPVIHVGHLVKMPTAEQQFSVTTLTFLVSLFAFLRIN